MTSTCKPQCVAKFSSQLRNDQYMTLGTSTWSPGRERLEHGGRGGHSGREQQRRVPAFERGQHRFGLVERRVVVARVDATGPELVVRIADERRGQCGWAARSRASSRPPSRAPGRRC